LFDLDEEQLITRTKQGDVDVFNPLVIKYQPRIYAFIQKQVKDTETAKDLTQEAFLKAFRALNTCRGDSAFALWFYRIAENVCIDYFRKQQKAPDIEPCTPQMNAISLKRIPTLVETSNAKNSGHTSAQRSNVSHKLANRYFSFTTLRTYR